MNAGVKTVVISKWQIGICGNRAFERGHVLRTFGMKERVGCHTDLSLTNFSGDARPDDASEFGVCIGPLVPLNSVAYDFSVEHGVPISP